jgi:polar amino acid transport system permease protein
MEYIGTIVGYLLEGTKITIFVFFVTFTFSIPFGLLGAIAKQAPFRPLRLFLDGYTWVIRGTPLLLQLFFVVYGLPILFGRFFLMDELLGASVAFIINYTAYFIEIFRGGISSIHKGQFEASTMLGLSKTQTYQHVIVPQAVKKVLPAITNEAITLVKDTALLSAVAISDLLRNTREKVNQDFRVEAYLVAAVIYLFLSYVLVWVFKKIEKKYAYYR